MSNLKDKIIAAKKILGDKAIDIIVDELNILEWDDKNKKGICPFHNINGEHESTPSFTWNPKDDAFKCFGCGIRYGILDHYHHMGKSFRQSVEQLFCETNTVYEFYENKLKDYKYPKKETNKNKDKIYEYLEKRKISKHTIDNTNLKQDYKGNMVFEYYDELDRLLLVKYRPSRKLKKGETKNWCQKDADTSPILWGINQTTFEKPLIVVEGEIDRLSAIEAGFTNVVSIPFGAGNYQWIERNWDFLDNFNSIIVCADNDEAGKRMLGEVIPRLGEWRCKTIIYPNKPNGTPFNDLNEILYYQGGEYLYEILYNAVDVPIKNVVDLADISEVDLVNAIGIKSGVKELDKRIAKFYLGTLAIWTGINGSGKSSLLNQVCVAEPTNQGFKSFVFSGELSKSQLRNWIEYPMAGIHNIEEVNISDDQPTFYKVKKQTKELMRDWYRGKIFVYDDEVDKSANSLFKKMDVLARKHGVKNFLIDNLMTVDISEYKGASVWEKQKEFVLDLIRFAIRYNVVIHLVAHPRKLDFVKRLSKMDVSGSGDITNLAHYVLAIHRVTNQEKEGSQNKKGDWITEPLEFDAILDLFKNRPIGFQDVEIGLFFNKKSKRFYKTNAELYKRYNWDGGEIKHSSNTIIEGDGSPF